MPTFEHELLALQDTLGCRSPLLSVAAQAGRMCLRLATVLRRTKEVEVLISTMNDIPGFEITEVFGEVFGLTVRSRNIGSQFGAVFKSLAGGELKGMTKNLSISRQEVIDRMVQEAETKGANAVIAMRFDTSEMGGNWTEICAYGTAVAIRKL
jgi:uncharacterized protein YbjQ (UPF0145 family)